MGEPDGIFAILKVVSDFYQTGIDDHFFVFVLFLLIAADIITGVSKAWALKEFSSNKMRQGVVGHVLIFVTVAVSYPFFLFAGAGVIADSIISALCVSYGLSFLKNLQLVGVDIPLIDTVIKERVDGHKDPENDKKE